MAQCVASSWGLAWSFGAGTRQSHCSLSPLHKKLPQTVAQSDHLLICCEQDVKNWGGAELATRAPCEPDRGSLGSIQLLGGLVWRGLDGSPHTRCLVGTPGLSGAFPAASGLLHMDAPEA